MDAVTHREVGTLRGHVDGVPGLAYSPDGLRLLSADTEGPVPGQLTVRASPGLVQQRNSSSVR
jgi:hypothetical protein